jgi:hypothetical protein
MGSRQTAANYSPVGILLLLLSAASVFSQQSPGPPPIDSKINTDRARQQDMSKREWQLRNFGNEPGQPPGRREIEALMAQTEKDFNRILVLHNEIARAISSKEALRFEFVSNAMNEIRKRANRLKTIILPKEKAKDSENEKPLEAANNESQLRDALIVFCKRIKNFVTNPVIENPGTVNAEELVKARSDLDSLIQLSGQIKKDADELKKTQKQ